MIRVAVWHRHGGDPWQRCSTFAGPEAVRLIVRLYGPAPEPGRMPPDALAGRRLLRVSSDLPHACYPAAGSLCVCHWLLEHRTVSRWMPGDYMVR